MEWDVIVVGAGPAGCFTALQIAEKGFRVLVVEEHTEIGQPVQCAGLISHRAMELAGADQSIVRNTLTGLRVFSPLGSSLHIEGKKDLAIAVDRAQFDRTLAEKAAAAGAALMKGVKVTGLERIKGGFRLTAEGRGTVKGFGAGKEKITLDAKLLIGADGSKSKAAKWLQLERAGSSAVMYAVDAKLKSNDTKTIRVFLGQEFAPGWFGWVIPLDADTCRVGCGYALIKPELTLRQYFQRMTDRFPHVFKDMQIVSYTGGVVPLGMMPKMYTANAMLVGDAACQTKPISGGGLYFGLRGAQICGQIASEALQEDNLSEERLSSYQKCWEKEMKSETVSAMRFRESYLSLRDEDIESLLRVLNKPRYHELMRKYGDIDYPSRLAKKLLGFGPWQYHLVKAALRIAEKTNFI